MMEFTFVYSLTSDNYYRKGRKVGIYIFLSYFSFPYEYIPAFFILLRSRIWIKNQCILIGLD